MANIMKILESPVKLKKTSQFNQNMLINNN